MTKTPDLDTRFARLREVRRRWFGTDAEAMFGAEEDHLARTLTRRRLADDPAALAAFDAARPPAQIAAEREATASLIADEQTRQLDALDATPVQRHAEREALWGSAAAALLAALDAERADWDRRVATIGAIAPASIPPPPSPCAPRASRRKSAPDRSARSHRPARPAWRLRARTARQSGAAGRPR